MEMVEASVVLKFSSDVSLTGMAGMYAVTGRARRMEMYIPGMTRR